MNDFLLRTDSYKVTHWNQYPEGTTEVYSYLESRGGMFPATTFFGLQYYIARYLSGAVFSEHDIAHAEQVCRYHFGAELFNRAGWEYILKTYNGRLPLEIKAVPEGTVVPVSNVLMTVRNTDPKCFWLTNWIESLLLKVWYPITVATLSREIRSLILSYLRDTGNPELIDFKLHDFGYRGTSSEESAALGDAAHLINFKGTDTLSGINLLYEYYLDSGEINEKTMPGFSIPATEHSTITSWGKEHEADAYRSLLKHNPRGLVACVSDSYDIFNACDQIWGGQLRQDVLDRDGTVVIRPDSGRPQEIVLKVVEILGEKFGYEDNDKGFRVLNPKVRVIQGDGVNYHTIGDVLRALKNNGWSADNIAFGMGGALLQQLNRDTQKFAFKCSNVVVNGKDVEVWKDPVTDPGKWSKRGRLALHEADGLYTTSKIVAGIEDPDDLLETVFLNGIMKREEPFYKIRARAEQYMPQESVYHVSA